MAAGKLVVSTPVTDVVEPYGDIVYIANGPSEFISACETALAAGQQERAVRAEKVRAVLARSSWDSTAKAMERLISDAEEKKTAVHGQVSQHVSIPA